MTRAQTKKILLLSERSKLIKPCTVKLIRIEIEPYLHEKKNKYGTRNVQPKKNVLVIRKSKSKALQTKRPAPRLNIKKLWNETKMQSRTIIKKNDFVCAKVNGFRPWPAQIMSIVIDSVRVKFFGSDLDGVLSIQECVHFIDCAPILTEMLLHPVKDFEMAVQQCEEAVGIPKGKSLVTLASRLKKAK